MPSPSADQLKIGPNQRYNGNRPGGRAPRNRTATSPGERDLLVDRRGPKVGVLLSLKNRNRGGGHGGGDAGRISMLRGVACRGSSHGNGKKRRPCWAKQKNRRKKQICSAKGMGV